MTELILGLDVSTSNTGVVFLDTAGTIVTLDHIDFKGCETFWEKCDRLRERFQEFKVKHPKLVGFYIEEPMKRFAAGFSSAEVISTLQRFNGIACFLARETWGLDPTYINVSSARKLAGIKVTTKAKAGGRDVKTQVFDHMAATDLSHVKWPLKQRSPNIVDWAKDVTDAYVIAKAGAVLNTQPRVA
jgi:hypothetical protein